MVMLTESTVTSVDIMIKMRFGKHVETTDICGKFSVHET